MEGLEMGLAHAQAAGANDCPSHQLAALQQPNSPPCCRLCMLPCTRAATRLPALLHLAHPAVQAWRWMTTLRVRLRTWRPTSSSQVSNRIR